MFKFAVFDPRPIQAAAEANDRVFAEAPQGVLGIEVTVPALAARCMLGNLDPQHAGGDATRAAIEAALTAELPPDGATLATVRADLDSIGAMAVLSDRAANCTFHEAARERIALVAASDKFARGGWPGTTWHPFSEPVPKPVAGEAPLAAMAAAVGDFKIPIAKRVAWVQLWLHTGAEPEGYRVRYEAEQAEIARALGSGAISVKSELVGYVAAGQNTTIATVVSSHRAAMSLGYRCAPVVVALNPEFRVGGGEPHAKFTVAQFEKGYVDLAAVAAELNRCEPGWGGSPTIVGSPQGVGSKLTLEDVFWVVRRHLKLVRCTKSRCGALVYDLERTREWHRESHGGNAADWCAGAYPTDHYRGECDCDEPVDFEPV